MRGFVKNISFLCILLFVFSLFACSSTTTAGKSNNETQKQTDQAVKAKPQQKNTVNDQPSTENKNTAQTSTNTQNSTSSAAAASSTQTGSTSTSTAGKSTSNSMANSTSTTKSAETKMSVTTTVKQTTVKPVSQPPKPSSPPVNQQPALTVTLSITGPKDHPSILPATKVAYKQGDTVYTVLSREAKLSHILIGSKGSGATLYIQGLEDESGKWSFYEFDYGAKSGWTFKVNGAEITRSAGITSVKAGDRIECIYVQ